MPCHRNFSITDPSNQICPLLTALDFHNLCPAFLHKACSVANGIFRVNLVRPIRHVHHQQRVLHASTHGLNVMEHFIHRDRQRVLVAQHGLCQRITH